MINNTLTIENKDLKNMFVQLDSMLSQIEVKGESVTYLFKSRMMINDLFSQIKEKSNETCEKEE